MAKKMNRKKPGYTKSGEVKIISLSYKQLAHMIDKVSKKKTQAKILRRMGILERSPGFVNPIISETTE